jgi:hypothetical protein
MTIINNRFAMSAPPSELVSGEYHERDTFPAHPKTLHLRLRRAVTLEMIIYARRELVEETDHLLEDLDVRDPSFRGSPESCTSPTSLSENTLRS